MQACSRCCLRFAGVRSGEYASPAPQVADLLAAVTKRLQQGTGVPPQSGGGPAPDATPATEGLAASSSSHNDDADVAQSPKKKARTVGPDSNSSVATAGGAGSQDLSLPHQLAAGQPAEAAAPSAGPSTVKGTEAPAPSGVPAAPPAGPSPDRGAGGSALQTQGNGGPAPQSEQPCPLCLGLLQALDPHGPWQPQLRLSMARPKQREDYPCAVQRHSRQQAEGLQAAPANGLDCGSAGMSAEDCAVAMEAVAEVEGAAAAARAEEASSRLPADQPTDQPAAGPLPMSVDAAVEPSNGHAAPLGKRAARPGAPGSDPGSSPRVEMYSSIAKLAAKVAGEFEFDGVTFDISLPAATTVRQQAMWYHLRDRLAERQTPGAIWTYLRTAWRRMTPRAGDWACSLAG